MPIPIPRIALLSCLAAALACEGAPATSIAPPPPDAPAFAMASGEWSEPVHLGPEVNSPSQELAPSLSPDGLSLYFNSDRPATTGAPFDLWVSRRECLDCPWGPARNLGSPVNGPEADDNDGTAALSHDGHLLFWSSNREGSVGGSEDLWMASRTNPNDDFAWGEPVNLGPLVNTDRQEAGPSYVAAAPGGPAHLYFHRDFEVWVVTISRDGTVLGPPVHLSHLGIAGSPSVRRDGLEMILWAGGERGGLGLADVWASTRRTPVEPWGEPVNLGPPVNTAGGELESSISFDGMTLVFSGTPARGGSLGRQDIWISTRRR
jgi:hypothetical protein